MDDASTEGGVGCEESLDEESEEEEKGVGFQAGESERASERGEDTIHSMVEKGVICGGLECVLKRRFSLTGSKTRGREFLAERATSTKPAITTHVFKTPVSRVYPSQITQWNSFGHILLRRPERHKLSDQIFIRAFVSSFPTVSTLLDASKRTTASAHTCPPHDSHNGL